MPELSRGQRLALFQLCDIVVSSNGGLEILAPESESKTSGYIWVQVSVDTKVYRTDKGLPLRDRERLWLHVPFDFPFIKPDVYFSHKRFVGTPHVQWGNYICLYQSVETEYEPADGMFGFLERVDTWLRAAGRGELDPDDAPLHPPVAYTNSATAFVVRPDTPTRAADEPPWIGRADLRRINDHRFDLVGWTKLADWGSDQPNQPIAAAILLNQPLAAEFPTKVSELITLIENSGVSFRLLFSLLRLFALASSTEEPAYLVLGAPMRRRAAGEPLRPHLTAWEIEASTVTALRDLAISRGEDEVARDALVEWMVKAKVQWCPVLEDRPEIVNRRDDGTPLSKLAGKRVLLLGCGALGSAVAEMALRAGVQKLHLADSGMVKPGILVRQRYTDADIGKSKARALQTHLEAIGLNCQVTVQPGVNSSSSVLSSYDLSQWDLIVDATASTTVARRIEEELKTTEVPIPVLSMSVSAEARHGSVLVKMPSFLCGPHHVGRMAKLAAFAKDPRHPIVQAFWPDQTSIKVFQPEPGCSSPTFIGSAADVDHHAAGLLNIGLQRIDSLAPDSASIDLVAPTWDLEIDPKQHRISFSFKNPTRFREKRHDYTVLRSERAARDMAAELSRNARVRSERVESGGLIFGEVDDSHRHIWVDSVSGPPPDSTASEFQFVCGTSGTQELSAFMSKASGKSSRFIGIWHTHPISRGRPSQDDLHAMLELLHFQNPAPRQIVMLILGHAATAPEENYYLFRSSEFVLISTTEAEL